MRIEFLLCANTYFVQWLRGLSEKQERRRSIVWRRKGYNRLQVASIAGCTSVEKLFLSADSSPQKEDGNSKDYNTKDDHEVSSRYFIV